MALAGSGGLFWLQADCPLPCGLDTDGRLAWQSGSYFWAGACGLTGMQPRTNEGGGFMLNGLNSRGQRPSISLITSGCSRLGQAGLRQQVGRSAVPMSVEGPPVGWLPGAGSLF